MTWQQLKPQVLDVLHSVFGFNGFRGVQEDAVKAALQGRDCFVLMPTGGGKSLCFSLPAAVTGGLVLVVSPLIALMQDQVSALQATGVAADYLSSTRSAAERKQILDKLTPSAAAAAAAAAKKAAGSSSGGRANGLALLYVTPELIATDSFRQRLRALHSECPGYLKLIAVDEAHCISSWGHDYRPTYRQLSKLRVVLKGVPCMALTATATPQVRQDILSSLQLSNPAVLTSSFNRPNIHYSIVLLDVQPSAAGGLDASSGQTATHAAAVDGDDDGADDLDHAGYAHLLHLLKPAARKRHKAKQVSTATGISQLQPPPPPLQQQQQQQKEEDEREDGREEAGVRHWPGPIAIVYALKRATVDALTRRLRGEGLAVAAYHAALPAAGRAEVLQQWRAGQLQAVVASVAFGMGVDKGDIELVVHYNLPRSIEGFYQESGRAGRNGQPARSVLMYATRDRRRMDWILQKDVSKKASSKRKKHAAAAASSSAADTTLGAAGSSTAEAAAGGSDPAVAAAALRAFGGVVDLCCTAGCRRQRVLGHFGEDLEQQQQPALQQPQAAAQRRCCCDHCDDAGQVAAAVQRLQLFEQQLVQSRFGPRADWTGGRKRQKADGDGATYGFGGSSDEEDEDEGGSSDELGDEDAAAVTAALAAAKRQAAAVTGRQVAPARAKQGVAAAAATGSTDAFLAAMLQAEQAHARKAAASNAPGGDKLEELMLKKKQRAADEAPTCLPRDVRSSRRAKLAQIVIGNSHLQDCSTEAAEQLAAAYESFVAAQCGADAAQHKARLMQIVHACKAADGWLDMPELQLLAGLSLQATLQHGVAAAVAAAAAAVKLQDSQQGGSSSSSQAGPGGAERLLQRLAQLRVTADSLEATGVAAAVKKLRKSASRGIADAASDCIAAWRETVASSVAATG